MSKLQTRQEIQNLMLSFLERGGKITVGRTKRTANSRSWAGMHMRGSIAHKGRKATKLRSFGYAKAN